MRHVGRALALAVSLMFLTGCGDADTSNLRSGPQEQAPRTSVTKPPSYQPPPPPPHQAPTPGGMKRCINQYGQQTYSNHCPD